MITMNPDLLQLNLLPVHLYVEANVRNFEKQADVQKEPTKSFHNKSIRH